MILFHLLRRCCQPAVRRRYNVSSRVHQFCIDTEAHGLLRAYLSLFLFTYSNIADTAMLVLNCVPVGPYRVLQLLPSIHCTTPYYHTIRPIIIVWLAVDIIIAPVVLAIWLRRNRTLIVQSSQDTERYSVLFENFKKDSLASISWSVMLLGRRALLVSLTLLPLGHVQSTVTAFACLFILLLHIRYQPYQSVEFNALETASLVCHNILALILTSGNSTVVLERFLRD
jgi:hypothetical protein